MSFGEWSDWIDGQQQRWVTCPRCKGQGHWFDGVSIKICPQCSNEGEVRELRAKPKTEDSAA